MSSKKDKKKKSAKDSKKSKLDVKDLIDFGIFRENHDSDLINDIDSGSLLGGKGENSTTSLCQNWPTIGSFGKE